MLDDEKNIEFNSGKLSDSGGERYDKTDSTRESVPMTFRLSAALAAMFKVEALNRGKSYSHYLKIWATNGILELLSDGAREKELSRAKEKKGLNTYDFYDELFDDLENYEKKLSKSIRTIKKYLNSDDKKIKGFVDEYVKGIDTWLSEIEGTPIYDYIYEKWINFKKEVGLVEDEQSI